MIIQLPDLIEIGKYAVALAAIIGIVTWFTKLLKEQIIKPFKDLKGDLQSANKELKEANRLAIQYTITRAHEEYTKAGSISTYSLRCLMDLHAQYKVFDGNHFVDALMEEVKVLRTSTFGDEKREG